MRFYGSLRRIFRRANFGRCWWCTRCPAPDDWLICMVSSQFRQSAPEFDDVVRSTDADFGRSGLHTPSAVRVGRLAVVKGAALLGALGEIAPERLRRIRARLAEWLGGEPASG